MSNILNSTEFGERLYNSLPPVYRYDDASVNFALKRYLEALSEGGFEKVIEEINGLLTLVDPDKISPELLPILFKHYGFDAFNGIPELYLRKMLPILSELYARKGGTIAIEYLTALISGVKSSVEMDEQFSENHTINVELEMNYGDDHKDMPDQDQLLRIIRDFVPFYCDVLIVYLYIFEELGAVSVDEFEENLEVNETTKEVFNILVEEYEGLINIVYNDEKEAETKMIFNKANSDSITNKSYNQLGNNFFYTNSISAYDTITFKGITEAEYLFHVTK